jgi:hypothetical protein
MKPMWLGEDAARRVLLVRSIETEDSDAVVLTRDDRSYATSAALAAAPLGENSGHRDTAAFLARRASLALDRLIARYPTLARVCGLSRWPHWLGWAVPLVALAAGFASDSLEGGRLNVLAFPLLGMIAWNLAVYVWILIQAMRGRRSSGRPLLGLLERVVRPAAARLAAQPTLERGVQAFARDWSAVAAPLTRHRASRTLHLAAALFALGILAGMLIRARYTAEYSAGWAGTWAGAEREIAAFLGVILWPASLLTDIPLPSAERLRELRGGGENAGRWLILWTVTTALLVIGPRLIMSVYHASRAAFLKRRLPIQGEDFYVRSLVRNAIGRAMAVRVVPYSFVLAEPTRDQLRATLVRALGEKTRVEFEQLAYGEEDSWLAREGDRLASADQIVLLFNLGSTPEAENHGAFVAGVKQRATAAGAGLTALLDDTAFRRKLRGGASTEHRVKDRVEAWKTILAPHDVDPVVIALESADEPASARALEAAMLRMPAFA